MDGLQLTCEETISCRHWLISAMHFVVPSDDASTIQSQAQHTLQSAPEATAADCAALNAIIGLQPCPQKFHAVK